MAQLIYKTQFNSLPIERKFKKLVNDPVTRRGINQIIVNMSERYVPVDTGALRKSVQFGPSQIKWTAPYARYLYYGEVYGPNIPIIVFNTVLGFWSPKKKYPTGRDMKYHSPGTGSRWVERMMRNRRQGFKTELTKYMKQRAKEINKQ